MVSTTALNHLIQLGRQRGGLEIDDIRQALPIDTMTAEELADVLTRLDEAGIAVEIDPALLTPRRQEATPHQGATAGLPRESERATTSRAHLSSLASSVKAAKENADRTGGPARRSVKMSGTIFVVAAALILLILALGVWRLA